MRILAFDTCFGACSVAVVDLDGAIRNVIASRCELMATGHAERVLPMVQETMAAAACTFLQLDAIAVPHGPGTFTGVRTGIACARGLALASSLPVYTLSSLALLARTAAMLECFPLDVDHYEATSTVGWVKQSATQHVPTPRAMLGRATLCSA